MFRLPAALLLCLLPLILWAQAPDTLWTRTYGGNGEEVANGLTVLSDGRVAVAGFTTSEGMGEGDGYLLMLSANGDTLFTRTYGGAAVDYFAAVLVPTDSTLIFVGKSDSYGDALGDLWLVCIDLAGDTLWQRTAPRYDRDVAIAARLCSDGAVIAAGQCMAGPQSIDFYTAKFDTDGHTLWVRTFGVPGVYRDELYGMTDLPDGGAILVGTTSSLPVQPDVFVVRINGAGDTLWQRRYDRGEREVGYAVATMSDGTFLITGTTTDASWTTTTFGLQLDSNGAELGWQDYPLAPKYLRPSAMTRLSDGDVLVSGTLYDDWGPSGVTLAALMRLGATGDLLWEHSYGSGIMSEGRALGTFVDSGFLLAGYTTQSTQDAADVFVVRTDRAATASAPLLSVQDFSLAPNFPNPFNATTQIRYSLPRATQVSLKVFDLAGREVAVLVEERRPAGEQAVTLDAHDLASGVYFARLQADGAAQTRKLMLLK